MIRKIIWILVASKRNQTCNFVYIGISCTILVIFMGASWFEEDTSCR